MEIFKNANLRKNLIISVIFILATSAAFGLGRLSVLVGKKQPIAIEGYHPAATSSVGEVAAEPKIPIKNEEATYVASKNGKSYYFPWCGTVKRIKPENLVYFNSKAEAEKAGYSPGRCSGLK